MKQDGSSTVSAPGNPSKSTRSKTANAASEDGSDWRELELKLVGAPTTLRTMFRNLDGAGPPATSIVSTYYDTPDDRLSEQGFSLRLRQKDEGFELTLKKSGANPLERSEWTSRLETPDVDIALLPGKAPRKKVRQTVGKNALVARYTTDARRARKQIRLGDTAVEAALDIGKITSDDRETPLAELEFELIRGSATPMLHLVKSLLGRRKLALSTRSKSVRGLALATGTGPFAQRAAKTTLRDDETVGGTFGKLASLTAAHILANTAAARAGQDPEGVHQLRVALRRLRSMLILFEDHLTDAVRDLREPTRLALKRLGPARDLDVFVLETMPPLLQSLPDDPALARLLTLAEERRRETHRDVAALIVDADFNRLIAELLILADAPESWNGLGGSLIRPHAEGMLRRRHKQLVKAGRGFADLGYDDRHEVRIAVKKLRYACDQFQSLFPKRDRRDYMKRLARLQDDLGSLNDASLAEHIAGSVAGANETAVIGAAFVKGWYRHRLASAEPDMRSAWDRFTGARPFWKA